VAEAKVYLQLEPVWSTYRRDDAGGRAVDHLKVTKVLKNRPERITGVVVELRLRVPDAAFKPLAPVVTIDVPESALDFEPQVTVEMPDGGGDRG
jgi:hypothetical protein